MLEKTGVNFINNKTKNNLNSKTMEKEKKITKITLKKILKKNKDNIIDMWESKAFAQERYNILFDDVICRDIFKELKKYNNEFFIMQGNEKGHLILVIYK